LEIFHHGEQRLIESLRTSAPTWHSGRQERTAHPATVTITALTAPPCRDRWPTFVPHGHPLAIRKPRSRIPSADRPAPDGRDAKLAALAVGIAHTGWGGPQPVSDLRRDLRSTEPD